MSDAANRFADVLANRGQGVHEYPPKMKRELARMAAADPELHTACMEAITGREFDGKWTVPNNHVADAMRATGYRVSHHTVQRWRRAWLDEHRYGEDE